MRFWNRFWLIVLSLLLAALGAGLIWMVFYADIFLSWAQYILDNRMYSWFVLAVGAVFIILAVAIISGSFAKREPRLATVEGCVNGQVNISFPAIESMVHKAASEIIGIKELKPEIKRLNSGVAIYLHVVVFPDLNIPELVNALQETVKTQLESMSGLKVAEVKVFVANVANEQNAANKA